MIVECNLENFEKEVLKSEVPVLVDFWASWCGPCRMIAPHLETLANENSKIKVVKINVDDNGSLADKYQIRSIPTLILFNGGIASKKMAGATNLDGLRSFVN